MSRKRTARKKPTPAQGSERETARQASDLAALRRMLVASQGCFSLSFAVCDDRTLRNTLVQRLCSEFSDVVVVELGAQTADIYQAIQDRMKGEQPSAVFVLDIEASIPAEQESQPILRGLNSSRELWEPLACPVVFWLASYAATLMASKAPDFWRYRSHQFEFVSELGYGAQSLAEPFPGFEAADALPFEEKRFRVAELESRLREVGISGPDSLVEQKLRDLAPHILTWIKELTYLYSHASRFSEAQTWLRRAIELAESVYGPDHRETANFLNELALLLKDTNRPHEAEPLMRRVLSIDEKANGSDSQKNAVALNNLGQLFKDTNRLHEAEKLMQQALALDERYLGTDHPDVARDLNNLALLLKDTNRLQEAEILMRRALAIYGKNFGLDHPAVAAALNNLAHLLQVTSRQQEAEPLMRQALAIDERYFGSNHPRVARELNNIAGLLTSSNRPAEAYPLFRQALRILIQSFGNEHPHSKTASNNYRSLLKELGKSESEIASEIQSLKDEALQTENNNPFPIESSINV